MPKRGEGGEKTGGNIEIRNSRLLQSLFASEASEGREREYEVERRFKPERTLSESELTEKSKGNFRDIAQAYIIALDRDREKKTVRLRRTSPEPEVGALLRIVHKAKVKNPAGRDEYQIKFPETDERASEFNKLWAKHKWHVLEKRRYYIRHTLPNGVECEIHYDVHTGDGPLAGFVRIEVEFKNDEDEAYVRERHGKEDVLPDWIGTDVTADARYGSKALCEHGRPTEEMH